MDECKPLPQNLSAVEAAEASAATSAGWYTVSVPPWNQGLILAHFKAQLEDLREHIAPDRAQLVHLPTHPPLNLSCMGDKVCIS